MRHNALSTPVAAPSAQPQPSLSHTEIHLLEEAATTPEQFRILSRHPRQQAEILRREAQEQNSILEKDRQHASGPPTSPNPADRTQGDLEHQAEVALLKARTFEVRADAADASQPKG